MSDDHTPVRSISEYGSATKIEPEISTIDGSLAMLHKIAWKKENPELVFRQYTVERDAIRADVIVGNAIKLDWRVGSAPAELLNTALQLSSILVRDEYTALLRDIIQFATRNRASGEGDMHIDMDPPLLIYNPFKTEFALSAFGATVLGSPGIGKSTFLIYVLALRLLFGRTTIIQWSENQLYILTDEGVFSVDYPIRYDLKFCIPRGAWFLIDSNQILATVPPAYSMLCGSCRGFILQAASPRTERFTWLKKSSMKVRMFWMAPWTLAELIAGRTLQVASGVDKYTELALENFAKLYGTCARHAYSSAMDTHDFKSFLRLEIAKLNREKMSDLLHKAAAAEMDDTISQYIIAAGPIPGDRQNFTVGIPTDHLVKQLLDHLRLSDKQAAMNLYRLFIQVPYTRAGVGYILEKTFLDVFPSGGEWPITTMKRQRTGKEYTHWHFERDSPRQYLRLGFLGRPVVTIEGNSIDASGGTSRQLERHHFKSEDILTLERRFYIPQSKTQATFDAFVYEPSQRKATMFQVTVAKRHDISIIGLDWLDKFGVASIDLVVVTSPMDEHDKLDMYVANSHKDMLENVYCLVLEG